MQLKRFEPKIVKYITQDALEGDEIKVTSGVTVMDEDSNGRYVKFEDVKKLLQILAEKVRLI